MHPPTGPLALGGGRTQDFFDAAVRGRRWRASPTATLTLLVAAGSPAAAAYARALTEVASAACSLGEPTMRVIGNASVAAAAQLQAAGELRTAGSLVDVTRAAGPARVVPPASPAGETAPQTRSRRTRRRPCPHRRRRARPHRPGRCRSCSTSSTR